MEINILKIVPAPHQPPQNIDELLCLIAARDSEVALLTLMVDKLNCNCYAAFAPSSVRTANSGRRRWN